MTQCSYCHKEYVVGKNSLGLYCSNLCQQSHKQRKLYDAWVAGEEFTTSTRTFGNWLRKFEGNQCAVCGITEWNNRELKMQCDHIDGNHENNKYSNLRLVCYNCDAQLPTFKARNKGNGRHYRRARYAAGQSY